MMTFTRFHGVLGAALLSLLLSVPAPVSAREGVDVGKESGFTRLVPAEQIEASAQQQYLQLASQAKQQGALLPDDHP